MSNPSSPAVHTCNIATDYENVFHEVEESLLTLEATSARMAGLIGTSK